MQTTMKPTPSVQDSDNGCPLKSTAEPKKSIWKSDLSTPCSMKKFSTHFLNSEENNHVSPTLADSIADTEKLVQAGGVLIPADGWYGMCFGWRDMNKQKESGGDGHSSVENEDFNKLEEYSLYVQQSKDLCQRLSLPLTHENHKGKQNVKKNKKPRCIQQLKTVQVGKLLFLTKGAVVLVVHENNPSGRRQHQAVTTGKTKTTTIAQNDKNNKEKYSTDSNQPLIQAEGYCNGDEKHYSRSTPPIKWCIVEAPHHISEIYAKNVFSQNVNKVNNTNKKILKEDDVNNNDSTLIDRKISSLSTSSKKLLPIGTMMHSHLICSTCGRTFRSIRAVLSHALEMHQNRSHPPPTVPKMEKGATHSNATSATTIVSKNISSIWDKPLRVAFQDDFMLIVVKPQGMPVMGASPSLNRSDLLMPYSRWPMNSHKIKKDKDLLSKPLPVHRLDSPTGGLLVVAKTQTAKSKLSQSFEQHTCRKRYRALVLGKLDPTIGECKFPLHGKESHTKYAVVNYYYEHEKKTSTIATQSSTTSTTIKDKVISNRRCLFSSVDLYPITGRKHQLRKHMKEMGHPIYGDTRYGSNSINIETLIEGNNQTSPPPLCLWAVEIRLPHPVTNEEMACRIENPNWADHVPIIDQLEDCKL